jgi:hypothetical protein
MKTIKMLVQQSSGTRGRNVLPVFALGFMLAHMPVMAQAQSSSDDANASEEAIEEIVVSGTRRALQNSIDIKRQATGIVDAMSIGDIGDIPSLSVGEAIEQITGAS